jgi:hypothetical protein
MELGDTSIRNDELLRSENEVSGYTYIQKRKNHENYSVRVHPKRMLKVTA